MNAIDEFLNKITMYRTVLYGLCAIVFTSFIYSFTGILLYSPLSLLSSLVVLIIASFAANFVFSKFFKAPANTESFAITALILFLILAPISRVIDLPVYITAAIIAMGSKYILAINKKHIFNPVAVSLVVLSLFGVWQINWWVGNSYIFPVTLIVGLLILRKLRHFSMFTIYFVGGILSISFFAYINGLGVLNIFPQAVFSWPILFLGTIMLTEPLTTPPHRKQQLIYGGLVGLLSGAQFNLWIIHASPELALLVGNLYSYLVSFRKRLVLTLISKRKLSPSIFEFIFSVPKRFRFLPGQYFEWTLTHKNPDSRGVRRYFTIASSPTEKEVKIGVRINQNGSSFKTKLVSSKINDKIYAGNLAGDFVLPKNKSQKLVFIAGGIGITPFRSIIKFLIDRKQKRDIALFYSVSDARDFVYKDIFDSASQYGVKTVYICSHPPKDWSGKQGHINEQMIREEVPDYSNRTFYISGPEKMVNSYKLLLKTLGVNPHRIVTDYFPGY